MSPIKGSHHFDRRVLQLIAAGQGEQDDMLTSNQVAEWLGVSPLWLINGRSQGFGPKFVRLGSRTIMYRRKDILAFLDERTYARTSDYDKAAKNKASKPAAKRKAG